MKDGMFNMNDITHFLDRFRAGSLPTHIKSEELDHVHEFDANGIRKVIGETLEEAMQENHKELLIFLWNPECSVCQGINKIFVNLAKLMKKDVPGIELARFDTQKNHLPPYMRMYQYPLILFVPSDAEKPSEYF